MTEKKTIARKLIDWEAVERDYRTGAFTDRQLGTKHGCSHTAIQKRAKVGEWKKARVVPPKREPQRIPIDRPSDRVGFVYVIYLDAPERFYKIGMSQHFWRRFGEHKCASPFELCVACAYFTDDMAAEERHLHAMFEDKRVRGEWFRLTPEDLAVIASRSLIGGA